MADARNQDYRSIEDTFIRFDEPGLLGADTNGAAPEKCFGFVVEAEMTHHEGEVTECYWLRPVMGVNEAGSPVGVQNFLFTADRQAFGRLLSTMHDTLGRGAGAGGTVVGHGFEGRRNWAQENFDPEAQVDDNIDGLQAVVGKSGAGHLEVTLVESDGKRAPKAVARLDGHMAGAADRLRATALRVMEWSKEARADLDERAEEHKASASPSP